MKLAGKHGKHTWGYALLGGAGYFGLQLLVGFVLGLLSYWFGWYTVEEMDDGAFGWLCAAISGVLIGVLYFILKWKWSNRAQNGGEELDDELIS